MKNICKIILCGLLSAAILGSMTGCEESRKARDGIKKVNSWATENAESTSVNFVKEKYGFTAGYCGYASEKSSGLFFTTYTGCIVTKMEYQGKYFYVSMDCVNDYEIADTYQQEEIEAALINEITTRLQLPEYIDETIWFTGNGSHTACVYSDDACETWDADKAVHDYYDGDPGDGLLQFFSHINFHATFQAEPFMSSLTINEDDYLASGDINCFLSFGNIKTDVSVIDKDSAGDMFRLSEKLRINSGEGQVEREYDFYATTNIDGFEIASKDSFDAAASFVVSDTQLKLPLKYTPVSSVYCVKTQSDSDNGFPAAVRLAKNGPYFSQGYELLVLEVVDNEFVVKYLGDVSKSFSLNTGLYYVVAETAYGE